MLALIRTLGPVVALVIGLAGGGTIIGAGAYLYNIIIDNPRVAREATQRANDACTIKVQDAAAKATAAERQRQQSVMQDALKAYQDALQLREAQQASMQDQFEQEIADYDAKLAAEGRSCTLDDDDIGWLRGQ